MPPPLVSIVIPTYKPDFLDEAIESALAQTYPKTEIVISDNCRGDEVRDVSRRYPQIRYHRNPETGVYNNFRSCIRLAGGEFVKFLLDDDLLERNCIDRLVSAFELAPDITLTCGWYRLINDRGNEVELRRLPKYDTIMSSPGGAAAPMLMSARNPIGPLTTCMFRKKSFPLGMGPWFFNPEAPRRYLGLVDMAIILDLAFAGRVAVLAEPLSSMRTHALQLSNPANNPRAVSSIRSWLTLAEDAHAFGLLSESQFSVTLDAVLALFRRFRQAFPPLENDIARLEEKMASRAATAFPSS
ncbi:MAG TPA: glycosyltransferase family A protein [Denitromonas sp.]|nr:glycosyltransferase family A protein [Denitromonas sp.]